MTDDRLLKMGFTPEGWADFLKRLAEEYGNGKLISHDWLKEQFGLKKCNLKDFDSVEDFVKALEVQQFAYMQIVDAVRWELLKQEKMYIRNVRGDGYEIIRPEDQVQYGYDGFISDIKKAIREAGLIMNNVCQVDLTQQSKDNDLRAKFGMMKQMLNSIRL